MIKKIFINKKKIIVFLLMLLYINFSFALDGIKFSKKYTEDNKIINIIEVDPSQYEIISSHASELNKSKAQIEDFAEHHKAIIAINGGFFKLSDSKRYAVPAGVLKVNNKWHGISYVPRAAIGWNNLQESSKDITLIDIVDTKSKVLLGENVYKVNNFNPLGYNAKNSLYSFGNREIFPDISNCNLLIDNDKVIKVNSKFNNLKLGQYIFTKNNNNCSFNAQLINEKFSLDIQVHPSINKSKYKLWTNCKYIVGGAPLLIYNGKKVSNYNKEVNSKNFIYDKRARTAIGILKNNHWLLVVVEENPLLNISGISIPELAELMASLGCKYALNLDGGGSTSLYVSDSIESASESLIGDFSIAKIRPISDAIVVKLKN